MLIAFARFVRLVAGLIAAVIVAAIALRLLAANPANAVVKDIHDLGRTLVGPFKNLFSIKDAKTAMAANWGLAAILYLLIGGLLASLLARSSPRRVRSVGPVV